MDVIVIVVLMSLGLADGLASDNLGWPSITIPLFTVLPVALFWRHSHILAVTLAVSGAYVVVHGAMLIAGVSSTFLNVGVIAVTVYTLSRWASGRKAIVGLVIASVGILAAGSTEILRELTGAVALPGFLALFALLGVALRLWASRNTARISEAKMSERNRIARELHDTVAHHVSAIAIQAQGGQEIIATNPSAANEALAVIEQQASLTLTEMRLILGVLRDHEPNDLTPNPGLGDLAGLADNATGRPQVGSDVQVEVTLDGDLEAVSPSVGSAVFRLAQEAVTNARRHARNATHIAVAVTGVSDRIELTVTDDGHSSAPPGPGYGLLGMTERASLLGGECHAGPHPNGGWVVSASLPRNGRSA
jgi:signal transduction histidine kinase